MKSIAYWLRDLAVLTAAAIIVAFLIYWLQRRSKRLFHITRTTGLLSVGAPIRKRVKILYDDEPVWEVTLVEVTFIASGNLSILAADFAVPLKIDFGDTARVLSAEVSRQSPPDLKPVLLSAHGAVEIEALLLNSGDTFTVNCLVSGWCLAIVSGRIAGVRSIEERQPVRAGTLWWWRIMIFIPIVVSYMLGVIAPVPLNFNAIALPAALLVVVVAVVLEVTERPQSKNLKN